MGTSIVHNQDCMIGMREFPDKYFDLAVVDPPYGIGMDGGNVGYKGFNSFIKKNWDSAAPNDLYFIELMRVSDNQIIWGGNYFGLPPTRCFLVWDKGEGFYNRTYAECELAWTSLDSNTCKFKHDPLAKGDYKGKIHPTQKPVALYSWIYHNYLPQGGRVIDTHLGSGSNRIAAHKAGNIDFTGYEIDKDYYEAAEKRYNLFKSQLTLNFNQ